MDMRKLLVVASAAAFVTGSSFAAFAGQHHGSGVSKGESSSSIHLQVRADPRNPDCRCQSSLLDLISWGHGQNEEATKLDIWADDWQKATAPKGGEATASSFAGGTGWAKEHNDNNQDYGTHADVPNTYPGNSGLDGGDYHNNNSQTGSEVSGTVLVGGAACAGDC